MTAPVRIARAPRSAVAAALAASNLAALPSDALDRLLGGARARRLLAGSTLHAEGETEPHLELVVTGLVRVFVAAPDGRTLTVRYCRPGAILGAVSLFGRDFSLPATIQALVESEILSLVPDVVRSSVRADARIADALLIELSDRVQAFIAELPRGAFAPVRQRVARHILDLASESQRSSELVANVSQSELAAACGTVREGVARVLRDLRSEGILETRRGEIRIVGPAALVAIAQGEADGRG